MSRLFTSGGQSLGASLMAQVVRNLSAMKDTLDMNLSKVWEMVKVRKAWHAAVHGVANSRT